MTHDEITTKIELPQRRASDNIVRVDFTQGPTKTKTADAAPMSVARRSSLFPSISELDFRAPWVIRLVAVVAVLILSMLVL